MFEVNDISLSEIHGNIAINITYSSRDDMTEVLLERYEVPKSPEFLAGLRGVVDDQSVLQYLGEETALISTQFQIGGGDVYSKGKLININTAIENNFPFIIDNETNRNNNLYIYRILNFTIDGYESASRYVVGLENYDPLIYNRNLYDYEYIKFLDKDDIKEIVPDNIKGVVDWANSNSLFHETYRHRKLSEIESFKFSSYSTRAWINLHFIFKIMENVSKHISITNKGVKNGIYTPYN